MALFQPPVPGHLLLMKLVLLLVLLQLHQAQWQQHAVLPVPLQEQHARAQEQQLVAPEVRARLLQQTLALHRARVRRRGCVRCVWCVWCGRGRLAVQLVRGREAVDWKWWKGQRLGQLLLQMPLCGMQEEGVQGGEHAQGFGCGMPLEGVEVLLGRQHGGLCCWQGP